MFLYIIYLTATILLAAAVLHWLGFAPWVPTRTKDWPRVLELAGLEKGEVCYELGCGDGRVAAYLARNSGARVIGVEISWPLYLAAWLRQKLGRHQNLEFKFKNLYRLDLSRADAIYIFGMPEHLARRLKAKFTRELRPGARVITYSFPIKGWQPEKISKPGQKDLSIYLYRV